MDDIGKVLKVEIARIARREAAQAVKALNLTAAALKKELAALHLEVARLAAPSPAPAAKAKAPAKGKPLGPRPVKAAPAVKAEAPVEASVSGAVFTPGSIKELRKRLGLSQPAFAKLCGVSVNTVGRWETSSKSRITARPATLATLAKVQAAEAAGT